MTIREANEKDVEALKDLYFNHLTQYPPKEPQDMEAWKQIVSMMAEDDMYHLLVLEVEKKVVATVQLTIVHNLTHNLRPYAVIENVVTHYDYWNHGYASALLEKASEIAKKHNCYKVFLETGSNKERTLNFYEKNGFEIDKKHSCLKRL